MKFAALAALTAGAFLLAGCGDDAITDPTDVQLGETTFVFVLNPTVNDVNEEEVSTPGPLPSTTARTARVICPSRSKSETCVRWSWP